MVDAVLRMQVATVPDNPPGESRNDGVSGQLLTLTSIGLGNTTHTLRFVSSTEMPPPVITQQNGTTWTLTPNGGPGHTYVFELECGDGAGTEIIRRTYRIPSANLGLLLPGAMEACSPSAAIFNSGPLIVDASHDNSGGNYFGYALRLDPWFRQIDAFARGYDGLPSGDSAAWRLRQGSTDYINVDTQEQAVEFGRSVVAESASRSFSWFGGTSPVASAVRLNDTALTIAQTFEQYTGALTGFHAPVVVFARGRGTRTSPSAVAQSDWIGTLYWAGHDGTDFETAASISVNVTGAPAANSVPASMLFSTTPVGSQFPVERFRVRHDGPIIANGVPIQVGAMTTTVRDAFSPLSNGMIVYNTTVSQLQARVAGNWVNLSSVSTLNDLSDVVITSPSVFQVILYDGANWINSLLPHAELDLLGADDHAQYALLAGRSGGQTLRGGIDGGNTLTLQSTAHASRGSIIFESNTTADADVSLIYQGGDGTNVVRSRSYFDASLDTIDNWIEQDNAGGGSYLITSGRFYFNRPGADSTLARDGFARLYSSNGTTEQYIELEAQGASGFHIRLPNVSSRPLRIRGQTGNAILLNLEAQNSIVSSVDSSSNSVFTMQVSNSQFARFAFTASGTNPQLWLRGSGTAPRDTFILFEEDTGGDSWATGIDTSRTLNDWVVSFGVTPGASDRLIVGGSAAGADTAGADSVFAGGPGRGTGLGGSVILQTAPAGTTGSALNALVDRLEIESTGAWLLAGAAGLSGQVITSNGAGVAPTWQTPASGVTDHGLLTGLGDDDHTQYFLLAGRATGQIAIGGTAASDPLTLRSTSNATRGPINLEALTTANADVEVRYQGGDGTNQVRMLAILDSSADTFTFTMQEDVAGNGSFSSIAAQTYAFAGSTATLTNATADATFDVIGNRVAGSASADVRIGSNVTRTAGNLLIVRNNVTNRFTVGYAGQSSLIGGAISVAGASAFTLTTGAWTSQTAGAEVVAVDWDLSHTVTHNSNTAIATQRDFRIMRTTHAFGVATGTITNAATFYVEGAPAVGALAAITNPYAVWIDDGTVRIDGALEIGGGQGTSGQVLTSNGAGVAPTWEDAGAGGGTLDAAYDFGGAGAGRTINTTDGAVQLVQQDAGDTTYALDVHYNAVAFTGTPHGILVDWTAATSLSNAADVYGLNMIGETNAGAGDSVAIRISGWDVAMEAVGTVDVTGNITVSGTVDGVDVSTHTHSGAGQGGTISHASLSNLTADDHTQYALLAGRAAGQTLAGGTAASDPLSLRSTTNATRGPINFEALTTSDRDVEVRYLGGDGTNQTRFRTIYDASADTVSYSVEQDTAGDNVFVAVDSFWSFNGNIRFTRAPAGLTSLQQLTTDSSVAIIGNRIAASSGSDVFVRSSTTRTVGALLDVQNLTTTRFEVDFAGSAIITGGAYVSGARNALRVNPGAWTGQTAGTDINTIRIATHTVTNASNTLIAANRDYLFEAVTHEFATAGGVIRDGATLVVSGAPIAGTNASITNPFSLWTQAGAVQFGSTQTADADQETRIAGGDGTNQVRWRSYFDASADSTFFWGEQDTAGDHTYVLASQTFTYGRPNTGTTTAARNTTFQWYWSDGATERVLELIAGSSRPSFRMPSASASGLSFTNAAGTTTLLTMDAQNNICTFSSGSGSTTIRGSSTSAMTIEHSGAGSTAVLEIVGGASRDTVIEFEDPGVSWWVGVDTSRATNDFVIGIGVLGTSDKLILGNDGSASVGSDSLLTAGAGVGTNMSGGHAVLRGGAPTGTGLHGMVVAGDLAATAALSREYVLASGDGTENVRTYLQQFSTGALVSLWEAAGNVARGSSDRTTFFEIGPPSGSEATGDNIDAWLSLSGHIATEAVDTRYTASIQLDSSAQALVYNAPQRSTDGSFTGAHLFEIADNISNAWRVEQGSLAYFNVTTTNSAESATVGNTTCGQVHCLNEATGENSIRLASGSDADEGKWFRSRRLSTASGGGPTAAITIATTSGHAGFIKIEGTSRDDAAGGNSHTWIRYYNWENNAGTVTLTQSGTSHSIGDATTADLTAVASGANIEVRCTHSSTLALQWTVTAEYHRTPD